MSPTRAPGRRGGTGATEPFRPITVREAELSLPLEAIPPGVARTGVPYGWAHVLVRLHGVPLGLVRCRLGGDGSLAAEELAAQVEGQLGGAVAAHLAGDGLSAVHAAPSGVPACCADMAGALEDPPLVSVVVPTMHRPEQIGACVDSVLASTYPTLEVIVVDNGPDDPRTRAVIEERFGTDSRVRYLAEPLRGASQARNSGLRVAGGAVVAFTDDDVVVDRTWLQGLVTGLRSAPDVVCATGLVIAAELDTSEQVFFEMLGGFERGFERATFRVDMQPRPTLLFPYTPGTMGSSNSMAVRADVARATGGFDTRLGPGTPASGGEDLDMFTRFLLDKGAIVYEPRAVARHYHRRQPDKLRHQIYTYGTGATAVLTKWATTSPELRSRLVCAAGRTALTALEPMRHTGIGRFLGRGEVRPGGAAPIGGPPTSAFSPGAAHSPAAGPLPLALVATHFAGYAAGPLLWARASTTRPERQALPFGGGYASVGGHGASPPRPPTGAPLLTGDQEGKLAVATSQRSTGPTATARDFRPIRVLEVELTEPMPTLDAAPSHAGEPYGAARILVRIHGCPIGTVQADRVSGGLLPEHLEAMILDQLGAEIEAHLAGDGLPRLVDGLAGLVGTPAEAPCTADLVRGDDAPLVTVIVATCRRPDQLEVCLEAILRNDYPHFEVLVVDNSPDDPRTRELLQQRFAAEKRIRYLREWKPGLSRARNTGLAFSRGEIVAYTDDDVIVDRNWLRPLVSALLGEPAAACATGLVLAAELETQEQLWFEHFGGFNKGYERRVFDLDDHQDSSPLYPYNVGLFGTGANMAFRKSMLGDLFQFDVSLGAGSAACGGEDLDCFVELLQQGYKLVYDPRSLVWHRHRRDGDALRRMMRAYGVGLSAFLTKQLLTSPHRGELLRKIPAGVRYARRPESRQSSLKRDNYPKDLVIEELIGMASGPFRYVQSRLQNAWMTA